MMRHKIFRKSGPRLVLACNWLGLRSGLGQILGTAPDPVLY